MQEKRDFFGELMQETKFTALPSHGSYFQCYTYEKISEEPDKDLSIRLTKELGVATIPISAFYRAGTDNKVIRFCFAKKKETLTLAVDKLRAL